MYCPASSSKVEIVFATSGARLTGGVEGGEGEDSPVPVASAHPNMPESVTTSKIIRDSTIMVYRSPLAVLRIAAYSIQHLTTKSQRPAVPKPFHEL